MILFLSAQVCCSAVAVVVMANIRTQGPGFRLIPLSKPWLSTFCHGKIIWTLRGLLCKYWYRLISHSVYWSYDSFISGHIIAVWNQKNTNEQNALGLKVPPAIRTPTRVQWSCTEVLYQSSFFCSHFQQPKKCKCPVTCWSISAWFASFIPLRCS